MSKPLRILQIAPRIPWPLDTGSAIGIYNITRSLAELGHQLTFVCFDTRGAAPEAMRGICELHTVAHDTTTKPGTLLTNLFSSLPYTISKYQCAAMREALRRLCTDRTFDVVHVDHIHLAPYGAMLKAEFGLPLLIREHNFETTIYARFAEKQRLPFLRWYMIMQTRRLLRFETKQLRLADGIAAITEEDAARIRAVASGPVDVVPAGVDLRTHAVLDPALEDGARVTLLGSMQWGPNLDSVEWFVDNIWPLIIAAEPSARLTIAGDAPPKRIQHLADERVEVPGFVDDLAALLARSRVLAVPLRVGGGMRIKLLEYFAYGKAVVSTGIGAEGNAAQDGEHIAIADDAPSFAEAVVRLLRDADLRQRLGVNARALVEQVYSWEAIGRQFEQCYHSAIAARTDEEKVR